MRFSQSQLDLMEKIRNLKREKNAVILVHNYQRPEIFEVADFMGDSLALCMEARDTDADIILFCGVHFMAESAAILNPDKKVVVPFVDAGCAMADMVDVEGLRKLKQKYPDAVVVTYVNSTAEIKAMSDTCCTSANAVDVVRGLGADEVIFLPDKNLADYVAKQVPQTKVIAWDGYCPIHHKLGVESVAKIRKTYPGAKVIAHPECREEVLRDADYIASTSGMIGVAERDGGDEFFVFTECGMTDRLHKALPGKKFHGVCHLCYDMKKNTLESVYDALLNEKPIVKVDRKIAGRALLAFDKMFEVTKKNG